MKKAIIYLGLIVGACSTFVSCTKEKDNDSYYTYMPGEWRLTQSGIDFNKNGIVDAGEVETVTTVNNSTQFFPDLTGHSRVWFGYFDVSTGFNWGLEDYQRTLWVAKGKDTARLKITTVGLNKMNLLNNTITVYGNSTWMIFERQQVK